MSLTHQDSKVDDAIDTTSKVEQAIARAQQAPTLPGVHKYIEVTQEVFDHYMHGTKTAYFTRGDPGVRVYIKGTRDAIESRENRTTNDQFGSN